MGRSSVDTGPRVVGYVPRHTPTSALARTVRTHGPSFFAKLEEAGIDMPAFVKRAFKAFARCGQLEHGFLRVACLRCGHHVFVPFS